MTTPALRAPDYIKRAAQLIAVHGWCGNCQSPLSLTGLNLVRAVMWAVAGRPCTPRDLTPVEAERVDEVLEHLEAERGLDMSVSDYERRFASASARLVAWEIDLAGLRYDRLLVPVS